MKNIMQYVFTSLIIVLLAIGLFVGRQWDSFTGLFPRVVGFPMLVLAAVILVVDIIKARGQKKDRESEQDASFRKSTMTTLLLFGWTIGFLVLIWLVGILYTIPVYVFAYMKVQGKYSWFKSAIYAVAAALFVFIVFNIVFQVVWPEGMIWEWLSR